MKTQGAILMVVVALLGCSCLACPVSWMDQQGIPGSGRVVEETRQVSGFTGIELATFGDLHIQVGEKEELRIEAEDNLIEHFVVSVHAARLKIETQPGVSLRPTKPVNFYLRRPLIRAPFRPQSFGQFTSPPGTTIIPRCGIAIS